MIGFQSFIDPRRDKTLDGAEQPEELLDLAVAAAFYLAGLIVIFCGTNMVR